MAQSLKLPDDPRLARAVISEIEKRRYEDSFVKYFLPFEYQKPVFKKFTKDIKILIIAGGNRSGKSLSAAVLTMAWALGKDYFKGEPAWEWVKDLPIPDKPHKNIWMVGLDFKMLKDVIWRAKLVQGDNHPGFLPKDGSVADIHDRDMEIEFKNGTFITGKSADSGREKFQGTSVDFIWLDEECDAEIFDECYQRTIDCGGKLIVSVTPLIDVNSGVKTPWIYNLYEEMRAGRKDIAFVNLSVLDNPVVPEEEKQKLLEKWKNHPEERARLFGEFIRRTGLVYPGWDRRKHLVAPTNPSGDWYHFVSIDPAATGITAALWGAVDGSGNYWLYREYYKNEMTVSDHARNIKARNLGSIDLYVLDPTWGAQRNAETHKTGQQLYRDAGIPTRLPEVGPDYGLLASMEYVNATLQDSSRHPKLFVCSNLTNFVHEIEHYTWDSYHSGPLKGLSKDKPRKADDHCMNAFQYAAAMKLKGRRGGGGNYSDEDLRRISTNSSYF